LPPQRIPLWSAQDRSRRSRAKVACPVGVSIAAISAGITLEPGDVAAKGFDSRPGLGPDNLADRATGIAALWRRMRPGTATAASGSIRMKFLLRNVLCGAMKCG
jgi:hypothetical protein